VQNVYPTLRITDYERSQRFYLAGLGFRTDWEQRAGPGLPVFVQISRDGLSLYLSQREGDGRGGGMAHLYVPDVDAWYAELREKDVPVASPPRDQAWGNREMRLVDPDGNQLCICKRLFKPIHDVRVP
jgi:catechol 2,3-dioxygenase-like lactoylglutathione lyase family enzyme